MPISHRIQTNAFNEVKRSLLYKLSPLSNPDVTCLPAGSKFLENYDHLCSMIRRTVTLGESNSILILGPRGSGKTALLKSSINAVFADPKITDNLLLVQLNGFIHTDDRVALKDFARQLRLSISVSEDEEIGGSFAEIFALILNALREEKKQGSSLMVTLEEFDLFCSHKSQTLLYNLLDAAQSAQTPIIVIGITTRFDVTELLEKRVKSRLSHRQIHIFHSKSFEDNLNTIRTLLVLPDESAGWNKSIEKLLSNKNVQKVLKNWFEVNLNYHLLKKTLMTAVIQLDIRHQFLTPGDIEKAFTLDTTDGKTSILNGLSVLELTLVVCILNYKNKTQEDAFNFHVIYLEYEKTAIKKLGMQGALSSVAEKAYQRLEQVEVIQACESRSGLQNEYRTMRLLVDGTQVRACLENVPNLPTALRQLASSIH